MYSLPLFGSKAVIILYLILKLGLDSASSFHAVQYSNIVRISDCFSSDNYSNWLLVLRLFRSSKSALPLLYSVFKDGHTPARQFLVAALSGPVMNVLQEDEFFLDIDPDKAMER